MAEAAAPEAPKTEVPKRTCEKCRGSYGPEAFTHAVEGQDCVCRRCLAVMGYRV